MSVRRSPGEPGVRRSVRARSVHSTLMPDTQDEVLALRHEVLRLRDRIVGLEAERDTAVARAERLEALVEQYAGLRGHLAAAGSIAAARANDLTRRAVHRVLVATAPEGSGGPEGSGDTGSADRSDRATVPGS